MCKITKVTIVSPVFLIEVDGLCLSHAQKERNQPQDVTERKNQIHMTEVVRETHETCRLAVKIAEKYHSCILRIKPE